MKFDKNLYEGLVRRPLMMVKKWDENLRVLALNERVGENYSLTSSQLKTKCPIFIYLKITLLCLSPLLKTSLQLHCQMRCYIKWSIPISLSGGSFPENYSWKKKYNTSLNLNIYLELEKKYSPFLNICFI
jgi:hypothetical protein